MGPFMLNFVKVKVKVMVKGIGGPEGSMWATKQSQLWCGEAAPAPNMGRANILEDCQELMQCALLLGLPLLV